MNKNFSSQIFIKNNKFFKFLLMESSIKFTFKKVLENYSNVDKCKEIIKEFYKEIKSTQKENPEFNSLLIHNLTKIVRTFYQEHLIV